MKLVVPSCACGCGMALKYDLSNHEWHRFVKNHDKRPPLCFCGCGERVNRRKKGTWGKFRLGHSSRTLKTRNQRTVTREGAPLCACRCGLPVSYDIRTGKWNLFLSGHNARGRELTEEQCRGISLRQTGRKVSETTRLKLKERLIRLWKDDPWRQSRLHAIVSGWSVKPTRPEKRFIDLCTHQNLPYRYNSTSLDLTIGGRIPDFYETDGRKEVVEIFGRYFHDSTRTPYSGTEKGKIEHYASYGFKCIVLWEDEDDEVWLKKVSQS